MEPCSWWAYNLSLRWNYQTKHTRGGNKGYGLPYKLSTVPPFLTKFDATKKNNERTKLSADYPKDTSFLFSSLSRSCSSLFLPLELTRSQLKCPKPLAFLLSLSEPEWPALLNYSVSPPFFVSKKKTFLRVAIYSQTPLRSRAWLHPLTKVASRERS